MVVVVVAVTYESKRMLPVSLCRHTRYHQTRLALYSSQVHPGIVSATLEQLAIMYAFLHPCPERPFVVVVENSTRTSTLCVGSTLEGSCDVGAPQCPVRSETAAACAAASGEVSCMGWDDVASIRPDWAPHALGALLRASRRSRAPEVLPRAAL